MPQLDINGHIHRKAITPWHDSESMCLFFLIFMLAVFWFGIFGIQEGLESAGSSMDLWVPVALMALSSFVIITTTIRLVRRYLDRFKA